MEKKEGCDCHYIAIDKDGKEFKVGLLPFSYTTETMESTEGICNGCGGTIKLMKI